MSKKSKLARALAKDTEAMERVRGGMYPASGGGAPSMPNQEAALNQAELDKALGNPVKPLDARPAITGHGGFNRQGNASHPDSWARGLLSEVPLNTYEPNADVHGHGVSHTLGDAVVSSMGAREAAGRVNGLTNSPTNSPMVRSGLFGSARGSATPSNGSHVASQSNVSNAVAGKSSSVDALKDALNKLSREAGN